MKKTLALITAGGRLDLLSETRSLAALPFAGKFRLIDFTLSNCVNSKIENVGVITQYMPYSLNEHLGIGRPWDLDRRQGGITILQPYKGKPGEDWYLGNAQAVFRNLSYIKNEAPAEILILPANLIYKMNYQNLIKEHRENNADLTVTAANIPYSDALHFSILDYDSNHRLLDIKKEKEPSKNLVSMGVFVFKKEVLIDYLQKLCSQGAVDFESEIIPQMLADQKNIFVSKYQDQWRSIRSVQSYWKSNLETTENIPKINLYDSTWPIFTRSEEKPPVKFGPHSLSTKSLIANGAIINGRVENSVIGPGAYIEEGSIIKDSIILNNSIIRKNSLINKSIIDKNVEVKENVKIGFGNDFKINSDAENSLENGLNVVAKNIKIAAGITIGRNCRIDRDIEAGEFENDEIKSGSTVE
ncbi:MAG: glucose-1-phosphate adenylyltransferase subunit GlgD [Halanaerobium sp.]